MRIVPVRLHFRKGRRVKAHRRRIFESYGSGVKGRSPAARAARRRFYGAPRR